MNKDRMSTVETAICDSFRSDPTRLNPPSSVCISGRPEFHHQALWRHLEKAGHAVYRFTEDLALLDAVGACSPSAIVYEIPAGRERAVQFLNQLAKLNHDACVILVGPEIGAESVAHCLRSGAFDYLTVPVSSARFMTSLHDGLVNRHTFRVVRNLSQELAQSNERLAEERNALTHWNRTLLALNHLTQVLTASLDSETIVRSLFTGLATLVPLDIIGLACAEPHRIMTWSRSSAWTCQEMQVREWLLRHFPEDAKPRTSSRQPLDLVGAEALSREDCAPLSSFPAVGDDRHTMTIPLPISPDRQGVLYLERREGTFTDAEFKMLSTVGTSLAMALRNASTHQMIQELALRDSMTGLLNRRALEDVLAREFKGGFRYRSSACLLLVDLDYFKAINDQLGHLAGDQVLRGTAALMRRAVRDIDVVGRYGGEEFGIVLPHTDLDCALVLAERLRREIESQEFEADQGIVRITASIGIAHIPAVTIRSVSEWIAAADSALYGAKASGRNRVVVHVPDQAVLVEGATVMLAAP
ncbi:MAG: diguanylate cyclase [Nitrospira sp. CG24A]|nr:MAG: diguanylate cyclase [Nitrospira sp. CG24A]